MWRYVSYPLSMIAGINGLVFATCTGFWRFTHTGIDPSTFAIFLTLGTAAGLIAGIFQSIDACEKANKRNDVELELKKEHAVWEREQQERQSEWERQEKAKDTQYERDEEATKKKFEREYRLSLDKLVGPDPSLFSTPPDTGRALQAVRKNE